MYKTIFSQLQEIFALRANTERAVGQRAYMKSSMPFWGITKPEVDRLSKALFKLNQPANNDEYRATVRYIFQSAQYREEWYAGLNYAMMFKKYITPANVDLYLWINSNTNWWDIVDTASVHLIGKSLHNDASLQSYLNQWISDENMWVRRTALITQLMYKKDTNKGLLASLIQQTMHEKEFFIRKAIGWALRQYSKTNPAFVKEFIATHSDKLSNLSRKEGSKYLA